MDLVVTGCVAVDRSGARLGHPAPRPAGDRTSLATIGRRIAPRPVRTEPSCCETGPMLEQVVTALAVVVALAHPVPQVVRVLRTRSVAGVSGPTTWLGFAINSAWVTYGVARGLLPVAVLSGAYVMGYVVVGVLLVRRGNRRGIGAGVLAAIGLAALVVVGGWAALGTVLALAVLPQFLPQVVEAWRADDLTGLAPGTYLIALVDGLVWGGFGAVAGDRPLVLYGVIMCSVAVAVLVPRYRWAARQVPVSAPPVAG